MASITILMENTVRRSGLVAEHGLALWINCAGGPILFDAGQTDHWLANAGHLGIDPSDAKAVVLSHGHYDHGGGLLSFPFAACHVPLYVHPAAFRPKFSRPTPELPADRAVGLCWQPEDIRARGGQVALNGDRVQIAKGVHVISSIPYVTSFEQKPREFEYETDSGQRQPDWIEEEQLLVLDRAEGLTVVLGCSHRGVVNAMLRVQTCFPGRSIHTVIGGTHLLHADADRVRQTAAWFRQTDVKRLIPLHCTGAQTQCALVAALGDRVALRGVGDRVDLV